MAVQNESGVRSFVTAEAITAFDRVTVGSAGTITKAGAGDPGSGIAQKDAANGAKCPVRLWSAAGTFKVKMAGAATKGDYVFPVASGRFDDDGQGAPMGRIMETVSTAASIVEMVLIPGASAEENNSDEGTVGPLKCIEKLVCDCGSTTLATLSRKMRVIDGFITAAEGSKNGTCTLLDGSGCAIAGAMTQSCTDETLTRIATLDDGKAVLAAGCVLVASLSGAQQTRVTVFLLPVQ